MDEDIKEIKRRAGLTEETYTMASQEQLDTLVDKERRFIYQIMTHLSKVQESLRGNTFNPRQSAAALAQVRSAMLQRMKQLEAYKEAVKKENV